MSNVLGRVGASSNLKKSKKVKMLLTSILKSHATAQYASSLVLVAYNSKTQSIDAYLLELWLMAVARGRYPGCTIIDCDAMAPGNCCERRLGFAYIIDYAAIGCDSRLGWNEESTIVVVRYYFIIAYRGVVWFSSDMVSSIVPTV